LHDQNPVSLKKDLITQHRMVTEIPKGEEERIISDEFKSKLSSFFEKYNIAKGKCLNDEQAKEFGCRRLKCMVIGTGSSQLAKLKNNYYKVATPNDSVVVGRDSSGNVHVILRKNRYLRKHMTQDSIPEAFIIDKVFRRGDQVVDHNGELFRIKKLRKSPVIVNREGVEKTRSPKLLQKVG